MNKKANAIIDGAFILAIITALVIAVFVINKITSDINIDIQADAGVSEISKTISANSSAVYPSFWDAVIVLLLVLFWCLSLITAHRIDSEPYFFVFTLIGIIIVIIAGMSMEDYYNDLAGSPDYQNYDQIFPKTNWIMDHIAIIILIISLSVGVVLHSKL